MSWRCRGSAAKSDTFLALDSTKLLFRGSSPLKNLKMNKRKVKKLLISFCISFKMLTNWLKNILNCKLFKQLN